MPHVLSAVARVPELDLTSWTPPGDWPRGVLTATTAPERGWLAKLLNDGGISHLIRAGGVRGMVAPITLLRHLRAGYRRHPDVDLYHINWLQTALPLPDDGKPVLVTVLGNDLNLLRLPFVRPLLRHVFSDRKSVV